MASDKTTVLIVEDEPAIVELVTFSLREAGWNCCAVQSVGEAWDFIQTRTPQLILLDWMLPDQTGLRLLARTDRDLAAQAGLRVAGDEGPLGGDHLPAAVDAGHLGPRRRRPHEQGPGAFVQI